MRQDTASQPRLVGQAHTWPQGVWRGLHIFALVKRRERYGLTRLGWLVLLCSFITAVFTSLFTVYPFLAVTSRAKSNLLIVEGWVPEFAIRAAVDESLLRLGF